MDDFPDVNVWVALSSGDHPFHRTAKRYFEDEPERNLVFCWATAMGLVRVTCQRHTFGGEPLAPVEAWQNLSRWMARSDVFLVADPSGLNEALSEWVIQGRATARNWTDLYLAAFARAHGMRLVTFDQAFKTLPNLDTLILAGSQSPN